MASILNTYQNTISRNDNINKPRLTQKEKDANNHQWYKDKATLLDHQALASSNQFVTFGAVTSYRKKKVNYDLFNNIVDIKDFSYVMQPYGSDTGELPANFTNRDIVSGKIKVLLGMEMKMPFSWTVVATDEEATTRKEQEEASQVRDFVVAQIMNPIKQDIQTQIAQQNKGKDLTPDEKDNIQQQIQQQTQTRTPDEVRRYMLREHQDPAEVQSNQILKYLIQKEKINDKFNKGFKHSNISGEEIYWVGIMNGEPCLEVINPLFFEYDMSPDLDGIQQGEWAKATYRSTPSDIVANFGSQLTDDDIDRIYEHMQRGGSSVIDADFTFENDRVNDPYTIPVKHFNFKALRKVGFLTYLDDNGEQQEMMVDENYKLNKNQNDIAIDWEWLPEAHEVWRILDDIYVYPRPVPGQHKDLDNLHECNLSYFGASCDNLNSPVTSPMDRMKTYQYFYNIIIYRIELLMASDKGKILVANINSVPKSAGIDLPQFQYFMEANHIAWLNPNEEGNKGSGSDITNMVKEIDMSMASKIKEYMELAEYIKSECGSSVGITPQMEAQIGANEAVSNTRQNLVQSSHIIQPYFELHNIVKGNVLTALLECAKVAYATGRPRKLTYVLDDMSIGMFSIDQGLLDASTLGLFISNSSKAADAKQAVEQLAQAALQNSQATLSDIIKVIRSESVTEAEELLEDAANQADQKAQDAEQQKLQQQEKAQQRQDKQIRDGWEHEKEMIILKESERRKTEIQKQAILSTGFDPNKDEDDDGTPDVMEIAKFGVDANIKIKHQQLEEDKFAHQQDNDKIKNNLEKQKLAIQKAKPVAKSR